MQLDYVPLLKIQRDLHDVPRGPERFQEYLRTICTPGENCLDLPSLLIMNPLGREHVAALLDALLAIEADAIAAEATAEAAARLTELPGHFKVTCVMADDLKGGWTNRYANEFTYRFRSGPPPAPDVALPRWTRYFWINGILWSSEPVSAQLVREAALTPIYRAAYMMEHGQPQTLQEMLAQEGEAMSRAACRGPTLEADDIAYTREVIAPYLGTTEKRLAMECLFGDAPGQTLGFTPRGLSPWAGLALALHDAQGRLQ